MQRLVLVMVLVAALAGCRLFKDAEMASQPFVTYHIQGNQYSVVYVEVRNTSESEAKDYVMQRAAQLARDEGFRYFTVDRDERVQVMYKAPTPDTQAFHQNLYEELIIQQDFGRNPYPPGPYPQNPTLLPGRKLTIRCYAENPGPHAIDACSLLQCG